MFLPYAILNCYVFTIIKLNKFLPVQLSKCLKVNQSLGRAPGQLTHIFTIKQLNIRPTPCDFFVIACLFLRPKVSGCARGAWSWDKSCERKNKLTQMHLQLSYFNFRNPISNVQIKNMYSCANSNQTLMIFWHKQLLYPN